jgi:hypothetical protein
MEVKSQNDSIEPNHESDSAEVDVKMFDFLKPRKTINEHLAQAIMKKNSISANLML